MILFDEDALICDLAETYHVHDYGSLPVKTVATLAFGLREDSRIKMALRGESLTFEQKMLVQQVDLLNINAWLKTRDAVKGRNRPESLYMKLTQNENKPSDFRTFSNRDDLMAAIRRSKNV